MQALQVRGLISTRALARGRHVLMRVQLARAVRDYDRAANKW